MTINAIENNTKVRTPMGHEGRVRVTRRERKLISDGKADRVEVLGTDGLRRSYPLSALTIIDDEAECDDNTFDQWFDDNGYSEEHRDTFRVVWEAARNDL